MRVYKLDAEGNEILHYDGEVVERGETWVHIKAVFQIEKADIGFVVFRRGDVFHEWFYTDCWYNIFQIEDGTDGTLKGWYCNITRPAEITENSVRAEDLELDIFVMPNGETHILDEDEFRQLSLSDKERTAAEQALKSLQRQVANRISPFEAITTP